MRAKVTVENAALSAKQQSNDYREKRRFDSFRRSWDPCWLARTRYSTRKTTSRRTHEASPTATPGMKRFLTGEGCPPTREQRLGS